MLTAPMASSLTHTAAVALGSNLGDRLAHFDAAFAAMDAMPGTWLVARSLCHETEPVGPPGQGMYLNAAAVLHTTLDPRPLLDALLRIERAQGRDRSAAERWGPRTLDLDLLLYDERVIDEPGLTLPHPRLHERLFVLEPLAEIAPGLSVPGTGATVAELFRSFARERP